MGGGIFQPGGAFANGSGIWPSRPLVESAGGGTTSLTIPALISSIEGRGDGIGRICIIHQATQRRDRDSRFVYVEIDLVAQRGPAGGQEESRCGDSIDKIRFPNDHQRTA